MDHFDQVLESLLNDYNVFSSASSFTSSSESIDFSQHDLMSVDEAEDAKPSCKATYNTSVHHLFDGIALDSHESDYGMAGSDIRDTLSEKEMLSPNGSRNGLQNPLMPRPIHQMPRIPEMPQVPQAQSTGTVAQSRDHLHKSMLIQLAMRAVSMASFHHDFNASAASAADMNTLHEEFNNFASDMSEMANDFNARLIKAESERDELLEAISQQRQQQQQLEQELERLRLQQRQQEHQHQQGHQYHRECEQEPQQSQPSLSNATVPVSQNSTGTGGRNIRSHEADDIMLLSSPVTPLKRLPADFSNFTVPAKNPHESSPFGSKLSGLRKPKSERTSARKALKIKIPGGPIPMASLKSGFPTRPAKSADARLQETVASPLPLVTGPASAPMPFTLGFPSDTSSGLSSFPSPFASGSSSCTVVPASPFLAGPSSSIMAPLSPFVDAPSSSAMAPPSPFVAAQSTSGMETPSRYVTAPSPSGMQTPSRYVAVPSSSGMGPSSPFVAVPSSSGLTPPTNVMGAPSFDDMTTPTPFMTGPPSSTIGAPTKFTNYMPSNSVDMSPLTPDRIGPATTGDLRSVNSVLKRRLNNLVSLLPPSTALIPEVPLTDTEIIVFFFQSLSRPVVALRLYARKWGPQTITAALNKHRNIEGGYLRNTTSVKCTSAIKKGRDKNGDAWYEDQKEKFADASDWYATELIRQKGEELEKATDFELSNLDMELKQYPVEGVDGGIFTRCVKWCCERKGTATYTLQNVHELVLALRWGEDPGQPSPGLAAAGTQQMMLGSGIDTQNANDMTHVEYMGDDTRFVEVEDAEEYEGLGEYEGRGKQPAT